MKTLFTLCKLIINGTVAIATFSIFVALELYVTKIVIGLLISDHGMNPDYGKYIWLFCYGVIAVELFVFILRVLVRGTKNFFLNLT